MDQIALDSGLGDHMRIGGEIANGSFGEEFLGREDYSGDGFPKSFVGNLVGASSHGAHSGLGCVLYKTAKLRGLRFQMNSVPRADIRGVWSQHCCDRGRYDGARGF